MWRCPHSRLPLLEAMIQEVLRASSMVHNGVQRAAQTDTYLAGYLIPKASPCFTLFARGSSLNGIPRSGC